VTSRTPVLLAFHVLAFSPLIFRAQATVIEVSELTVCKEVSFIVSSSKLRACESEPILGFSFCSSPCRDSSDDSVFIFAVGFVNEVTLSFHASTSMDYRYTTFKLPDLHILDNGFAPARIAAFQIISGHSHPRRDCL